MIEYKKRSGTLEYINVYLDKKRIGAIKFVGTGWQYFPNGWHKGGNIFPTISEVKKSLGVDEE